MPTVRCADCGFLAVRDRTDRQLAEVEIGLRSKWELPTLAGSNFHRYEDFPLCLHNKANLRIEKQSYQKAEVIALIQQDRECDSFTKWQHGFTPKEHEEMLAAREIQKFQEEQRQKDREWQAAQHAANQKWQEEQSKIARDWQEAMNRSNQNWQKILGLVAGGFALLAAGLSVYLSTLTSPAPPQVIIQTIQPVAEPKQ